MAQTILIMFHFVNHVISVGRPNMARGPHAAVVGLGLGLYKSIRVSDLHRALASCPR